MLYAQTLNLSQLIMISLWAFAKHTSMLWVLISSCGFACSRFVIFVGWVLIIICTNWMFKICILLARVLVIIYTRIKRTTKFHTLFKICIWVGWVYTHTHTHTLYTLYTKVQEDNFVGWILNSGCGWLGAGGGKCYLDWRKDKHSLKWGVPTIAGQGVKHF